MKIFEVVKILKADVLTGTENMEMEVFSVCGSDLMSDVMAYVKENVLLLTGLANIQVIRTAEMMDIKAIAFVRGKKPDQAMLELAGEKGIIVMTTRDPMFISCGKLYSAGITGRGVWD
ncbi:DRTGG domain-containing protein [Anaerobacterium chartisolvens]|uniref:DRTGG domain-containing protein n=1 Tax=Anaerobacterium chartisolvens TaxID=1297424 RepID=A0A369AFP7_9FIRM|nr:DRTGG domain-containing protein [Anaerobacterium chartisolvens]RCX08172.1 DRTGG domain-containing protein [Anaerobacterium chartisolvens]